MTKRFRETLDYLDYLVSVTTKQDVSVSHLGEFETIEPPANKKMKIIVDKTNGYETEIVSATPTANRRVTIPDADVDLGNLDHFDGDTLPAHITKSSLQQVGYLSGLSAGCMDVTSSRVALYNANGDAADSGMTWLTVGDLDDIGGVRAQIRMEGKNAAGDTVRWTQETGGSSGSTREKTHEFKFKYYPDGETTADEVIILSVDGIKLGDDKSITIGNNTVNKQGMLRPRRLMNVNSPVEERTITLNDNFIAASTSLGPFSLDLPSNAPHGTEITIKDQDGTFDSAPLTLNATSYPHQIYYNGVLTSSVTLDEPNVSVTYMNHDGFFWELVNHSLPKIYYNTNRVKVKHIRVGDSGIVDVDVNTFLIHSTGGPITMQLPTLEDGLLPGMQYTFKDVEEYWDINPFTIIPSQTGAPIIFGTLGFGTSTSKTLSTAGESMTFMYTGTEWQVINGWKR